MQRCRANGLREITFKALWMVVLTIMLPLQPSGTASAESVRRPVRAGIFYPSDPRELRHQIDRLGQNARSVHQDLPERQSLRALILPHAGYAYSGPTAAHAARVLSEYQSSTVVLLGPDHFVGLHRAAIPSAQVFDRAPPG